MSKRHTYRVSIRVDHVSREKAIEHIEAVIFKLKGQNWPTENTATIGLPPSPAVFVEMGPILESVEERLARIEREFDYRLGGFSSDMPE